MTTDSGRIQPHYLIPFGPGLTLTLWNMAYVGQAKVSRCKQCFSLTDCNWAPFPLTSSTPNSQPQSQGAALSHPKSATSGTTHIHRLAPSWLVNTSIYVATATRIPPQAAGTCISHKAMFCQRCRPSWYPSKVQPNNPAPPPATYQWYHPYEQAHTSGELTMLIINSGAGVHLRHCRKKT